MSATLFISYSRADMEDTDWLKRLRMYLTPFHRSGVIDVWDDSRIAPGSAWREEIARALDRAAAAVLLVGPGFLASEFIVNHELPQLLESARSRGLTLFPLVVGYSGYDSSELGAVQSFNPPGEPLESLEKPKQNKILNEFAAAIDEALRRDVAPAVAQARTPQTLHRSMQAIQRHLDDTGTAFVAQIRLRNKLVAMIEKRLGFKNTLQYERFFFRYHSQLDAEERFEFDQIRAMTEGPLQTGNRKILSLLEGEPAILELFPEMSALRQHLVFWLNKYDKVFTVNHAMCLLYTGVEDGVPFPDGVDRKIEQWLRDHPQ